ncbi:MAG: hypothetical protein FWC32_02475 [Firmicutes bacterium]|nr:hypothetical protein [Bacillota bacterium]
MVVNNGRQTVEFSVKLIFDTPGPQEIFIRDESGDIKIFTLHPNQAGAYSGEFYVPDQFWRMTAGHLTSVVLINDTEQHSPSILVRWPITRIR